jgi:hypothetical protein
MKFKQLQFVNTEMPDGIQAILEFGRDHELSIVKSDFSYGGKSGLYEIAVYHQGNQVEMPGITEQGDTVRGFLSEDEVEGIIKKMHLATGADPVDGFSERYNNV